MKTIEVFNDQGDDGRQLKLFPAHVVVPDGDPQVARVVANKVRLERTRAIGSCYLGLELWKERRQQRPIQPLLRITHTDLPHRLGRIPRLAPTAGVDCR